MVVLDVSIVNVALPSIRHSLGLSTTGLAWVVNAYTLAFAGFLLFGGRTADLFGRRRMFLLGLGLFTAASVAGGLAENGATLLVARAVQGLGAAVLAPSSLTVLTTTFTEPAARARALGAWGATAASGGTLGALFGGILTDGLSWRWVLFVNVPIGVALMAVARLALVESRGQVRHLRQLDLPGTLTVTGGLVALVWAIVRTDTYRWGAWQTLAALGVAAALLGLFVAIESRSAHPLVPLRIFRMRGLSLSNAVAVCLGAAMFGMFFFATLYLQQVLGYSALKTGLLFVPNGVAIILGARVATRNVGRFGAQPLMIVGTVFSMVGLAWLSRISGSGNIASHVIVPMATFGFGMGLTMVPMTIAGTAGVAPQEAGLASGLINTARIVGASVGLAALTTIAADHTAALTPRGALPSASAISEGYGRGLLVGSGLMLAALCIALFLPRAPRVTVPDVPAAGTAPDAVGDLVPAVVAQGAVPEQAVRP
jgi:EmrB/QacA subfamily drug resistance transporter